MSGENAMMPTALMAAASDNPPNSEADTFQRAETRPEIILPIENTASIGTSWMPV
ncbi:hypothetical protein D3C72_1411710 [compost metagenome]